MCYEWYFKDFQNQEVYKMITNRVDLKDYITLFKKYRIQFPKMSFLTFQEWVPQFYLRRICLIRHAAEMNISR